MGGLTHSLSAMGESMKSKLFSFLSTQITETYASHRTKYAKHESVYYRRNFGVIEIEDERVFNLKIYDAESGENVIEIPLNENKECSLKNVLKEMDNKIYFPRKYPFYGLEMLIAFGILITATWIIWKGVKYSARANKPKKS